MAGGGRREEGRGKREAEGERRESFALLCPIFPSRLPPPASRFPPPASRFPLPASRLPLPASRYSGLPPTMNFTFFFFGTIRYSTTASSPGPVVSTTRGCSTTSEDAKRLSTTIDHRPAGISLKANLPSGSLVR